MYKVVYRDKRVAILKDVSQLLRFLNPVSESTFKVYKSRKVYKMAQQEQLSEDMAIEHDQSLEHLSWPINPGCSDWTDWSKALYGIVDETDTLNGFYSGIEA
jgi:hypothetical protein